MGATQEEKEPPKTQQRTTMSKLSSIMRIGSRAGHKGYDKKALYKAR